MLWHVSFIHVVVADLNQIRNVTPIHKGENDQWTINLQAVAKNWCPFEMAKDFVVAYLGTGGSSH